MNLRSPKIRWFALIFLTLAGGFDFFTQPNLWPHEWWQSNSTALVSMVQVPALLTSFITEPQHMAGATAFLFLLILWRNIQGDVIVRGVLAVITAAFLFGTSAFVFLSAVAAAVVWALVYRRAVLRRRSILVLAGLAVLFLLLSGSQLALSLNQSGTIRWGEFRVVLFEAATGTAYVRSIVLDQILTLLAFPVVASILLLIEIGLPFALYAVWVFRNLGRKKTPWLRFLALYPAVYIPIAFLFQHTNFAMRGMLPVQIVIVLVATQAVEAIGRKPWTKIQRAILSYGFTILLIAQLLSAGAEWWIYARRGLAETLRPEKGFLALPIPTDHAFPDGDTHLLPPFGGLPEQLRFVVWVNTHLPADALLVEIGLPEDSNKLHLLERLRFVDPADLETVLHSERDLNIVNPSQLETWYQGLGCGTVWEKALRTNYVLQARVPVYVIIHGDTLAQLGEPVYQDSFVTIYLLSQGQ